MQREGKEREVESRKDWKVGSEEVKRIRRTETEENVGEAGGVESEMGNMIARKLCMLNLRTQTKSFRFGGMEDIVFSFEQFSYDGAQDKLGSTDKDCGLLDDLHFDAAFSSPIQTYIEEIAISDIKRLNAERIVEPNNDAAACIEMENQGLSTEEIIRIAGARIIQYTSQAAEVPSMPSHPFELSFLGLSHEEINDVELVELLLASDEKVGSLRERIDRETGRFALNGLGDKVAFDIDEAMMTLNPTNLAFLRGIPFCQLAQFSGTQAILENVSEAKKIHIIDLGIKNGMQWIVLMQALTSRKECPLELLKISVVGTTCKHLNEDIGKRLLSFAQILNLPFSFKIVMPNTLESLMKMIRNIKPYVMIVAEVEGNHNSPAFVNRFTEAFFFFDAYFDCLEAFLKWDDPNRMITESLYFGQAISNIVATEGEERKTQHVKINVWRAFFARFELQEAEFSTVSLYQAKLLVNRYSCGSS
ncbi:hypothetical protein FEM48_Zijuj12G0202700 [Ziziphus jujuba var. spinosa]|uniref:DELLA protein RGL1-like n=1 Tax=Ziziphus jujuba var. spinosa TaxID=714518 RepID=A0A978UFC1_ZIZJJ|nr:hypothetical protein FEM48_Zijuj12G0202700 [Ziziphus jujuba var. spinosa]